MKCLEVFARRRVLDEFDLYGDELTPKFQPAVERHGINYIMLEAAEIDNKQFSFFRTALFNNANAAEISDSRISIFQTLETRACDILHPGIAPFAQLLVKLSHIVAPEYYWLKVKPDPFHLHEAIQRVLLEWIFKMRDKDVLLNKEIRRKAPKMQIESVNMGSQSLYSYGTMNSVLTSLKRKREDSVHQRQAS